MSANYMVDLRINDFRVGDIVIVTQYGSPYYGQTGQIVHKYLDGIAGDGPSSDLSIALIVATPTQGVFTNANIPEWRPTHITLGVWKLGVCWRPPLHRASEDTA